MKALVKNLGEPKKYSWGVSWPIVTAEETDGKFNTFYKSVRSTGPKEKATYHKKSTEIHFIITGKGAFILGEEKDKIKVQQFSSIVIPPNTSHQLIPDTDMDIYVVSVPAVNKEDIFQVEE